MPTVLTEDEVTLVEVVCEAGITFLKAHHFLVETKSGKDWIVFSSGIRKQRGFWPFQSLGEQFMDQAKAAGKAHLRANKQSVSVRAEELFDVGVGKAIIDYIAFAKENPLEIEMQQR